MSMFFIKLFSKLPLFVLYRIADILYFIACYIVKYRKKTVVANLSKAFPEKSTKEIKEITKDFYKNLADIVVETIKGSSISKQEIMKRVKPINKHIADKHFDNKVSFIAMVSHMCNWEWVSYACSAYLRAQSVVIYQQQTNLKVDEWLKKTRMVFGAVPIEKKQVLRRLAERRHIPSGIGVIADQSPAAGENRFWTTFLHQETAFFPGGEKLARRFNYPVIYINMKRVKRGYYEMHFEEIAEPPFDIPEDRILEIFVQKLERDIKQNPSDWLWSHNRWKLKKPVEID